MEKQNKKNQDARSIDEKLKIKIPMFLLHFLYIICKISNFDMLATEQGVASVHHLVMHASFRLE